MNGLRTKLHDIQLSLATCLHDIIVLTETNLQPSIATGELNFHNYEVFRKDRDLASGNKISGGGVLVAVSKSLHSSIINVSSSIEALFVSLNLQHGNKALFVGAYIPPGQPTQSYTEFSDIIDEVMVSHTFSEVHILGDFNNPCTDWTAPAWNGASQTLMNMASMHNLSQINQVRNQRGVILDLVFTSSSNSKVIHDPDPLVPEEAHHPALGLLISDVNVSHSDTVLVPNLMKCDIQKVYSQLSTVDFNVMISGCDVNDAFDRFCKTISECVVRNSPVKKLGTFKFPVWFTKELRDLTIKKKAAHREYKKTLNVSIYNEFAALRSKCKTLSKACLDQYARYTQDTLSSNPRAFWRFFKSTTGSTSTTSSMSLDGEVSTDDSRVAEMFAQFFSSVFTAHHNVNTGPESTSLHHMSICSFLPSEVHRALLQIDTTKGCGPDNIPPSVVKFCCPILIHPLTELFNKSIAQGVFPDAFKNSFIIPIHKKGAVNDIKNYRPIAILSVLSKVFERLVLSKINYIVRPMISTDQHGFVPGRSTATNLLVFQSDIMDALNDRKQLDVVELDFAKAFDQVCIALLLLILKSWGIDGPLLLWFGSYLIGRKLRVRYRSALSHEFTATSGVPQGSILGPILFLIYINGLTTRLKCRFLLFADDLKLYLRISTVADCHLLQEMLHLVMDWCVKNYMSLNLDKCICITFNRNTSPIMFNYELANTQLNRTSMMRDLGVTFTSNLTWEQHIQTACNKAVRNLGLLFRMRSVLSNIHVLKTLYCCLVRPHLEYCSTVWSPHQRYLQDDLERVQRRFLRLVGMQLGYGYRDAPTDEIATSLKLPSLVDRRFHNDLLFLHRLLDSKLDCSYLLGKISFRVPGGTRSRDLFARPVATTNYAMNSPLLRMQRYANALPDNLDFLCCSYQVCKKIVTQLHVPP